MFHTLNYLAKHGISFCLESVQYHDNPLLLITKRGTSLQVIREIHPVGCYEDKNYDVFDFFLNIIYETSTIIATKNFKEYAHGFNSVAEAKRQYQKSKSEAKQFLSIFDGSLEGITEAVEADDILR